jgi:polyisoprenoid-binding protein YceI
MKTLLPALTRTLPGASLAPKTMRFLPFLLIPLIAGIGRLPAGAEPDPTVEAGYHGRADIIFTGSSTLHDFSGKVGAADVRIQLSPTNWTAAASVAVAKMDTANKRRDRNMGKMFSATEHPLIRGTVKSGKPPAGESGEVVMHLRIRDQERPVKLQLKEWRASADSLSFNASGKVSLKAFGLEPPSVLGIIRVGDEVTLNVRVQARKP